MQNGDAFHILKFTHGQVPLKESTVQMFLGQDSSDLTWGQAEAAWLEDKESLCSRGARTFFGAVIASRAWLPGHIQELSNDQSLLFSQLCHLLPQTTASMLITTLAGYPVSTHIPQELHINEVWCRGHVDTPENAELIIISL